MKIKNNINLLCLLLTFAMIVKGQNPLPYAQANFCFDQLIKVNPGAVFNAKNLVVVDLNNDTKKDVIVADATNSILKFYSFLAAGSFSFQNFLSVPGSGFGNGKQRAVDAGNFMASSPPGIVLSTDSFIYVFKNLGNFNFTQLFQIPIPQFFISQEHYIKVDDINGDGLDDFYFISANNSIGPGITVIPFRNATTAFVPDPLQTIFLSSSGPFIGSEFDISIADVKQDHDGKDDVMFTFSHIPDSAFFLENVSGTTISFNRKPVFLTPTSFAVPDYTIRTSEMADINGDGNMDFMFNGKGATGEKLVIYTGLLPFNLSFHVDIPTLFTFDDFKLAEINNDGLLDFVGVGNFFSFSAIVLYPGNGNNVTYFNPSTTVNFPSNIKTDELVLTDVDANGLNDIIFKPWKLNSDITYMIPNFSFSVNASPNFTTACSSMPVILTATSICTIGNYFWNDSTNSSVATGQSYTTNNAGYYSAHMNITMYSNATCTRYSDTVQVIDSSPVITFNTSNPTYACYGQTITSTASGAATYSWTAPSSTSNANNPTFTVQVYSNADYTVTGSLTNGCKGTAVLSVDLYPLNTDNILTTKNPVCLGEAAVLSMSSAISYTWNHTNYSNTYSVSPTAVTVYTLDFEDLNGCVSAKTITLDIDPTCAPKIYTGILLHGSGQNNFFRIDNIEKYTNNHVSIFNRWGMEIFSTNRYDNTSNYWPPKNDHENYPPSTYYFVVDLGDGSEIKKGWVELITN